MGGASAPVRVSRSTFDGQNGIAFAPDGALVYTSRSKDRLRTPDTTSTTASSCRARTGT